jgi:ribosomal protein S18 acetylase RimI-like enzyme
VSGLDLSTQLTTQLAGLLEEQQRTFAAIRYGSQLRVGAAHVVLNPDSPLASSNFACGLNATPGVVEATLERLPDLWDDAGSWPATVVDSPSSVGELSVLAEETGWVGVEELAVMLLTRPALLVDGEPGRTTTLVPERLESQVASVLADAFGYTQHVEDALHPLMGQRLDDPRVHAVGVEADGALIAAGTAFVDGPLGFITDVGVPSEHRGRGHGRAVASAAAAACLSRGAGIVWLVCEAAGAVERFWSHLGFETAYEAVTYQHRSHGL